jgi:methanogenic corrinoid protein MtbC1
LHSLPIAIVSDLVRLGGYDVLELGANVPTQAFVSAVTRTPRLVCVGIGVTRPEFLGSAQSIIDAIREVDSHIPVILGGLVTVEFERVMLRGVTATAKDGSEAVALIEALSPQRKMRRAV